MDVVIVIVALALVAGLASAMHAVIKPAVDWLQPPQHQASALTPATDPHLQYLRECKARREVWREEERRWRLQAGLD